MTKSKHVDLKVCEQFIELCDLAYENRASEGECIRLDEIPHDELFIKQLLDRYATGPYLCVCESVKTKLADGTIAESNTHYHVATFIEKGKHNALRAAIKRAGWNSNKLYSLKKADPKVFASHFQYLCKGSGSGSDDEPNVLYRSDDISDELITEGWKAYWANNAEIQANAKKRKRELPVSENIFNLCKHLDGKDGGKIYDIIAEYYSKRLKYLNPAYVRNLVRQTQVYLDPTGSVAMNLKDYCTGVFLQ